MLQPITAVATVWLRLSMHRSPPLQVPALGFIAGTERAQGFVRRWLKKEKKPPNKQPSFLAVPPLLLYSSEVQVLK